VVDRGMIYDVTVVATVTIFQALSNVHTAQSKVFGAEHIVFMSYNLQYS
jgi:hypothetical protein